MEGACADSLSAKCRVAGKKGPLKIPVGVDVVSGVGLMLWRPSRERYVVYGNRCG